MSPRFRFLVAGVLAIAVIAAYWVYAAWPVWRGAEIYLPVVTRAQSDGSAWLELSDQRLDPGFPGVTRTPAPGDAVFVPVRAVGNLWNPAADVETNSRQLRGRTLFVQFRPAGSPITGGWTAWRPASVGDGPIAGEVNLRALVQNVDSSGRLQMRYSGQSARLPRDLAGPLTSAYAILKVLPSGRSSVIGMIVVGRRMTF